MLKIKAGPVLLMPSLLSGLVTVFLTLAVISGAIYSYLLGHGLLYDFLFGPNSSAELIKRSKGTISAVTNTIVGNQFLNKGLFFLFWMLVGLIAYITIHLLAKGAQVAARDIEESTYTNAHLRDSLTTVGIRTSVRLAALLAWIVYLVVFVKTLLPFSILCARTAASQISSVNGWLYGLSGLFILLVCIHLNVVFMRLIALRVRLFGGTEFS